MNIVFHSAESFAYLLIANCICGVITASIVILISALELFFVNLSGKRFLSFGDYVAVRTKKNKLRVLPDSVLCVTAAAFMLFTSYIYNSGNFRILGVPSFLVGIAVGKTVLNKTILTVLNYILFCLKWLIDIAAFPIMKSAAFAKRKINALLIYIYRKRKAKIITKYTAYCSSNIKEEAKYGLIDDYYKELKNERTV